MFFTTIGYLLFTVAIYNYFDPYFIQSLVKVFPINNTVCDIIHYSSIIIIAIGIYFIIRKSIRLISAITISKLKIQNAEISIGKNLNKSILNHHIDELLFFFSVRPYNEVIIEDLDSFEETHIFTKLRNLLQAKELNSAPVERVPFTNLEELSYFLNTLCNQSTNQANPNKIKEDINFEIITKEAGDQSTDGATDGAEPNKIKEKSDLKNLTVGAGDLAIEIIKSNLNEKILAILKFLTEAKRRLEIFENIGLTNHSFNHEKHLDPLVKLGWIELTIPEKPTHQDQKYKLTENGEILYNLIFGKK